MKRTPRAIIIDLVVALNSLLVDEEFTINKLSDIANLHWETTNRYLELIKLIQLFSPRFTITPDSKISLVEENPNLPLDIDDRILLFLLQTNSISDTSASSIPKSLTKGRDFLLEKNFVTISKTKKYYLTTIGREIALEVFLELQQKIENAVVNPFLSTQTIDTLKTTAPKLSPEDMESLILDIADAFSKRFKPTSINSEKLEKRCLTL